MRACLLFLTLLLPAAADAHEYWLLPDRFAAPTGEAIGIAHRVGTGWPGESLPRDPNRIVRFAVVDARGTRPIDGSPGDDPAGTLTLRTRGLAIAFYRSTPTPITLEPTLFETYLRDEGLDAVAAARAAAGTTAQPARERFSRNAKAMLVAAVGSEPPRYSSADVRLWRRPVGLALEIVPETDPRELAAGAPIALRVLLAGKPLEGALVKAFPEGSKTATAQGRTDMQGRVSLGLASAGVWLVNAVHMTATSPQSGAEWESLWSSLTFALPAASIPGVRDAPVPAPSSADERVQRWVDLADPPAADRVTAAVRDLGGEVTTTSSTSSRAASTRPARPWSRCRPRTRRRARRSSTPTPT